MITSEHHNRKCNNQHPHQGAMHGARRTVIGYGSPTCCIPCMQRRFVDSTRMKSACNCAALQSLPAPCYVPTNTMVGRTIDPVMAANLNLKWWQRWRGPTAPGCVLVAAGVAAACFHQRDGERYARLRIHASRKPPQSIWFDGDGAGC